MDPTEWHNIIVTGTAVLYLTVAGFSFWRRQYRPNAALIMVFYAMISCGWALMQVSFLPSPADGLLARVPLYILPLLAILYFFLSRAFLNARDSGRLWWILSVVFVASTVGLEAYYWNFTQISGINLYTIALALGGVCWVLFMGGASLLTVRTLSPGNASRYQIAGTYWALVTLLTAIGDILYLAALPIPGNLLRLAGTTLAATIISQSRLASIGQLFRRSLSFIIYIIAALAFYTVGLTLLLLGLQNLSGLSLIITGLILAIALIIFFNPLLDRLRDEINLWITGDEQDPTYILRQYSQTITNILDLKLLAAVAVGTASQFLDVNRGSLFLVELEKGANGDNYYQLRGVEGAGGENPAPIRMRENCALALVLREEQLPVTQSEIDFQSRFKDLSPDERYWLSGLGAEVYVPVFAKNEWIGLLALGPKMSGGEYTEHDLFLLSTMSDQTAIALENTRLVEGLVRLNADFRRAYTALDKANRHLERLDRTKSDFISIASHELRTPLTLIRGSGQMLLDEQELLDNPYYKQLLSKIETGTDRLHEIIDSLLDVAAIDTRSLELIAQEISLHELIDNVHRELKPFTIERKQNIELTGLEELPQITADGTSLHKVFHHLIINAIKYTPDGGNITISGRELEPDDKKLPNGGVEIVVSDTGIGIDPRYQELIFAKFYQTGEIARHSTGKTKYKGGGPGLGLVIVRGIVEAHHGEVWVVSPGHDEVKCPGSNFHVVLPIQQETIELPIPSGWLEAQPPN